MFAICRPAVFLDRCTQEKERNESNALRIPQLGCRGAMKERSFGEYSEHLELDDWLIVALKWYQKVSFAKFNF